MATKSNTKSIAAVSDGLDTFQRDYAIRRIDSLLSHAEQKLTAKKEPERVALANNATHSKVAYDLHEAKLIEVKAVLNWTSRSDTFTAVANIQISPADDKKIKAEMKKREAPLVKLLDEAKEACAECRRDAQVLRDKVVLGTDGEQLIVALGEFAAKYGVA